MWFFLPNGGDFFFLGTQINVSPKHQSSTRRNPFGGVGIYELNFTGITLMKAVQPITYVIRRHRVHLDLRSLFIYFNVHHARVSATFKVFFFLLLSSHVKIRGVSTCILSCITTTPINCWPKWCGLLQKKPVKSRKGPLCGAIFITPRNYAREGFWPGSDTGAPPDNEYSYHISWQPSQWSVRCVLFRSGGWTSSRKDQHRQQGENNSYVRSVIMKLGNAS